MMLWLILIVFNNNELLQKLYKVHKFTLKIKQKKCKHNCLHGVKRAQTTFGFKPQKAIANIHVSNHAHSHFYSFCFKSMKNTIILDVFHLF